MTAPLKKRVIVLAVSSVVTAGVALAVWRELRPRREGGVRIVDNSEEREALFASRASEERAAEAPPALPDGPTLTIEPLDEATTRTLRPEIGGDPCLVYDPVLQFRRTANLRQTRSIQDPDGGPFAYWTNSLGMRMDAEVLAEKPDLRVLVTGDSHIDGVCRNADGFPAVLHELLSAARPGRSAEVLNAAVGSYNPYNYLFVLERYAELKPDVFIPVVYGGNDFSGGMNLQRYYERRRGPSMEPYTIDHFMRKEGFPPGMMPQELAQAMYFLNNPEDEQVATETMIAWSAEIVRRSRALGVKLLFVYLPPASVGQPELFAEQRKAAMAALGLERRGLGVSDRIADAWLAWLAANGVDAVDLRPAFKASGVRFYWLADFHLNVAGHRAAAAAVHPALEDLLE